MGGTFHGKNFPPEMFWKVSTKTFPIFGKYMENILVIKNDIAKNIRNYICVL